MTPRQRKGVLEDFVSPAPRPLLPLARGQGPGSPTGAGFRHIAREQEGN